MAMKLTVGGAEIATLLDRAPPGLRVLSLDCFDTLIWRTTHAPRDVFACIDHPGGAMQPRMWAEEAAAKQQAARGRGEVLLSDIYRRLHPRVDAAAIDALVARELAHEADHAFAFTPVVALMTEAKRRGLTIIIVSDMYMTEAQLRAHIAAAAGADVLAMIDHVFVSAAHGVAKGSGLFDIVLDVVGVAPQAVLHIGDNRAADHDAASAHGLNAVHFRQFAPGVMTRLRQEAAVAVMTNARVQQDVPTCQPHRSAIALRVDDDPAYVLGHDVLGPAMHSFALWLKQEVDTLSARLGKPVRPLFMMRDGYLPFLAFDALFPDAGARPVEISRLVAARAGIQDAAALEAFVQERLEVMPLSALARQVSLFAPEIAKVVKGSDLAADRIAFTRFIARGETRAKILKRSRQAGDRLMAHLRRAGVAEGDAIMLVDLGYNGSAQNLLTPVLHDRFGLDVSGRYLLLREEQVTGLDKRGMLDTRHHECRVLHAMSSAVVILEQLCNVAQGSTTDFAADGTPLREAVDGKGRTSAVREAVQAACMDYVRTATDGIHWPARSDTLDARVQAASATLARLFFLPGADELKLFETFDYDANLGTDQVSRLFDPTVAEAGLRRRGIGYVDEERRMYVAGEIQGKGLPLSMMMLSSLRFGLDLRGEDFEVGGFEVPVLLLGSNDQGVVPMTAWPTIDGYYRLVVPVGAGQFVPGVQLGAVCEMVQIESIAFQRVADIDTATTWRADETRPVLDEMDEVGTGVFRAGEGALVMVPPPPAPDPLALVMVFRPLVLRHGAAAGVASAAPARRAA
ncbi:hypothetical protein ASE75_02135 [Sphingomonas sp. Leaf17]|uniref:hypothetical protein n=1 Tax=Sphingomonas sp. Leaf17 TaxID=1735683 RepID=UPI0006FD55F7|nr:hypothetical protein [Sphingomonas sp. Leaf17]KQM67734.1 hypothetical protein ASE75_02135 [Sphingomonas sp. Leaf17]